MSPGAGLLLAQESSAPKKPSRALKKGGKCCWYHSEEQKGQRQRLQMSTDSSRILKNHTGWDSGNPKPIQVYSDLFILIWAFPLKMKPPKLLWARWEQGFLLGPRLAVLIPSSGESPFRTSGTLWGKREKKAGFGFSEQQNNNFC